MKMVHGGLAKLVEESGELQQVAGKVIAFGLEEPHPDNKGNLRVRLQEEIADVLAACCFVTEHFQLDADFIEVRATKKSEKYQEWENEPEQ